MALARGKYQCAPCSTQTTPDVILRDQENSSYRYVSLTTEWRNLPDSLSMVEMANSIYSSKITISNDTVFPIALTPHPLYTPDEKQVLRIIAIIFASLSMLAGTLMFPWYLRLQKRTFRHTYLLKPLSCWLQIDNGINSLKYTMLHLRIRLSNRRCIIRERFSRFNILPS